MAGYNVKSKISAADEIAIKQDRVALTCLGDHKKNIHYKYNVIFTRLGASGYSWCDKAGH